MFGNAFPSWPTVWPGAWQPEPGSAAAGALLETHNLKDFQGLEPKSQGQDLALTVLYVPSPESGLDRLICAKARIWP